MDKIRKRLAMCVIGILAVIVCNAQIAPPVQTDTLVITSVKYNYTDLRKENWPAKFIYKSMTSFEIGDSLFNIQSVANAPSSLSLNLTYMVTDSRCNSYKLVFTESSKQDVSISFSGYQFVCRYITTRDYDRISGEESVAINELDEIPSFMGGDVNRFANWVNGMLVYPEEARNNGAQGRVTLQFVINADGSLSDVKVLRGVEPSLDREAVRVVSQSPAWTPGKVNGKAVKVTYTFPVIFQLR